MDGQTIENHGVTHRRMDRLLCYVLYNIDAGLIEFVSLEQVLLVKLKNLSAHLAELKQ